MKHQTAIQELVTELETMKKLGQLLTPDVLTGLDIAIEQCSKKLAEEKKQLIDAYYAGTAQFDHAAEISPPKTPYEYYDETFSSVA